MSRHDIIRILEETARPLAQSLGLELWGVERAGDDGRNVYRIYVDSPDGVTIDSCAKLSRSLSVVLDVEDFIPGRYVLEVSSPGLERMFFAPEQMTAHVGSEVSVHLWEPVDNCKNFKGVIKAVDGQDVTIEFIDTDAPDLTVPWNAVRKARLRYPFPDAKSGPGPKGRGGRGK